MSKDESNLTPNEILILKGGRDNDFEDVLEGGTTWVFAVIETSGLSPEVARGVISSLVKKGLAVVDDWDTKGKADDMTFTLTEQGIKVAKSVLND